MSQSSSGGLGETLGDSLMDGLTLADGEILADGLMDGLTDGEGETLELTEALGDTEGLTEGLGIPVNIHPSLSVVSFELVPAYQVAPPVAFE